jgi:hypothetical protein
LTIFAFTCTVSFLYKLVANKHSENENKQGH